MGWNWSGAGAGAMSGASMGAGVGGGYGAAIGGVAGGLLGGFMGDEGSETKTQQTIDPVLLPGYADVDALRKQGTSKVSEWGGQPGYGAIPLNWNDLWEMSKKKTSQYFWGSPTDPGIAGKLKAKTAGQNMSGQPAETRALARLGATESGMLSDIAVKQAMEEAMMGEKGRRDWIGDVMNFQNVKPSYALPMGTTSSTSGGEGYGLMSSVGQLGAQLTQNKEYNTMLEKLLGDKETSGSSGVSPLSSSTWDLFNTAGYQQAPDKYSSEEVLGKAYTNDDVVSELLAMMNK